MTRIALFLAALFAATVALAACGKPSEGYVEGGLYSFRLERGDFGILKILKLDDNGVHVRVYANRFTAVPGDVNEEELRVEPYEGGDPGGLSAGHLPISKEGFRSWEPRLIRKAAVADEELDGYRIWKDAGGGYF